MNKEEFWEHSGQKGINLDNRTLTRSLRSLAETIVEIDRRKIRIFYIFHKNEREVPSKNRKLETVPFPLKIFFFLKLLM